MRAEPVAARESLCKCVLSLSKHASPYARSRLRDGLDPLTR
jgi:hypothetical protein